MKLTKPQIRAHHEAVAILKKDRLSYDEKVFVMENWNEGAEHINSFAGAFFTPQGLARDAMIELCGNEGAVIDLCAGIGALAFWAEKKTKAHIVCVEINPGYVEVGRKIVPGAEWVCASIFDYMAPYRFDCAISNPPFGAIKSGRADIDGLGGFEFSTILLASKIARGGIFILPQQSTPFKYSGDAHFQDLRGTQELPRKVKSFTDKTGIEYDFNCGIDCDVYLDQWRGVAPKVEVCTFYFGDPVADERAAGQMDLFEAAV
jgi:hypothetical protein